RRLDQAGGGGNPPRSGQGDSGGSRPPHPQEAVGSDAPGPQLAGMDRQSVHPLPLQSKRSVPRGSRVGEADTGRGQPPPSRTRGSGPDGGFDGEAPWPMTCGPVSDAPGSEGGRWEDGETPRGPSGFDLRGKPRDRRGGGPSVGGSRRRCDGDVPHFPESGGRGGAKLPRAGGPGFGGAGGCPRL